MTLFKKFDNFAEKLFAFPFLYQLKRRLIQQVGPKIVFEIEPFVTGKKVLDIGCGPGTSSFDLSAAREVFGVDKSPEFVLELVKKGHRKVFLGDAVCLPFREKCFDTVVISEVLHHLKENPKKGIDEAVRLAREYIILHEPEQSEKGPKRWIKSLWWCLTDGGTHYLTRSEWDTVLSGLTRIKEVHTGPLWQNVFYTVLQIDH